MCRYGFSVGVTSQLRHVHFRALIDQYLYMLAASVTHGHSLCHTWLQPPPHAAVASAACCHRHFRALIDQYMKESRHLTASVLLIDCTRGLCDADRGVLRQLWGSGMRVLPVLTKTDLLDQVSAIATTREAPLEHHWSHSGAVAPVSRVVYTVAASAPLWLQPPLHYGCRRS